MKRPRFHKRALLFTATQLSVAMGISRVRFFSFAPRAKKKELRAYGSVLVFEPSKLPDTLRELLQAVKLRHRCNSVEELIRLQQQESRRAAMPGLLQQRLAPGPKDFAMREVIHRY